MSNNEPTVTFPLSLWANNFIGDADNKPLGEYSKYAEVIEILAKSAFYGGNPLFYVQWPDKYDPDLAGPVLWKYFRWAESVDRWEKAKKKSEEERKQRFIFEGNVRLVARYCKTYFSMDDNWATTTAYSLLKNERWQGIKTIGVEKLITTIEEL